MKTVDISHYQDSKNMIPETAKISIIGLIKCSDNQIRRIAKPIIPIRMNYYCYDFESGKDIVLDTSEE
jgi:hypothetical protein